MTRTLRVEWGSLCACQEHEGPTRKDLAASPLPWTPLCKLFFKELMLWVILRESGATATGGEGGETMRKLTQANNPAGEQNLLWRISRDRELSERNQREMQHRCESASLSHSQTPTV